jgi:hypothetical protein
MGEQGSSPLFCYARRTRGFMPTRGYHRKRVISRCTGSYGDPGGSWHGRPFCRSRRVPETIALIYG